MTVVAGRVVTPDGVLSDGYVRIAGERVTELGTSTAGSAGARGSAGSTGSAGSAGSAEAGDWVVPGFVDLHVHGGGGYSFTDGDPAAAAGAAAFHLTHGTTTLLASLVASPLELMIAATRAYLPLVEAGVIAGLPYEGPSLAASRCGAQHPAYLRTPSTVELAELLDAGEGAVRMVTIAPELPGALDAIRLLVARGVVAAVGHTDATYDQTLAAVQAGATVGTHVFNAMRQLHQREPGPALALLGSVGVTCELVGDGVHLHDAVLAAAARLAGPGRVALVTDAVAAAGMADGEYELGGQALVVTGGVARLARDGTIAGSTLTMDAALRRAVHAGLSIVDAVRAASTNPAAALGLAGVGALAVGDRADLVVLDDRLTVRRVMRAGAWVR